MNIAIIGSRSFNDYEKASEALQKLPRASLIISGGAVGADKTAEELAAAFSIPIKIYRPDWDKHGKSAGFVRNHDIIKAADHVLAFWDGVSKGTAHSLRLARDLKITTTIVYF